jgi:hypothetical protein
MHSPLGAKVNKAIALPDPSPILTCPVPRVSWDHPCTARSQPGLPRGAGGERRATEPVLGVVGSAQPPGEAHTGLPLGPGFPVSQRDMAEQRFILAYMGHTPPSLTQET